MWFQKTSEIPCYNKIPLLNFSLNWNFHCIFKNNHGIVNCLVLIFKIHGFVDWVDIDRAIYFRSFSVDLRE